MTRLLKDKNLKNLESLMNQFFEDKKNKRKNLAKNWNDFVSENTDLKKLIRSKF